MTNLTVNAPRRQAIATQIALAFHISGFIAIAFFHAQLFISLTPLNLLVCLALIFWTQQSLSWPFIVFALLAFVIGFAAEYLGVHTGLLFGDYVYGKPFGPKWHEVPILIGAQWLVTTYCLGIGMHMLHQRLRRNPEGTYHRFPKWWSALSIVSDGALLAVIFDWVMEPVAVKLGYWHWKTPDIPWLNYFSWFGVSLLILAIFHKLNFRKDNLFAINLLLIQFMFFLLLRTMMK